MFSVPYCAGALISCSIQFFHAHSSPAEGKGRKMYREHKSRTPAKTATHFLKAVDEYGNTSTQRAELDWLLYNKPLERDIGQHHGVVGVPFMLFAIQFTAE